MYCKHVVQDAVALRHLSASFHSQAQAQQQDTQLSRIRSVLQSRLAISISVFFSAAPLPVSLNVPLSSGGCCPVFSSATAAPRQHPTQQCCTHIRFPDLYAELAGKRKKERFSDLLGAASQAFGSFRIVSPIQQRHGSNFKNGPIWFPICILRKI